MSIVGGEEGGILFLNGAKVRLLALCRESGKYHSYI